MNGNEPRVTTIIPSFNHAAYVADAIESVLAQDHGNHELIVVDDGSSDGSQAVINRYRDHPLVTVILNERNRGQSAALIQGLELASGKFIANLPSDDWLLPHRNRVQTDRFRKAGNKVGIVYGRGRRFFQATGEYGEVDSPLLRGDLFEHLLLVEQVIFPVTPLIRAECYRQFPPDPALAAEGEGLWMKMASCWHIDYVDEVVGVMRQHGRNTGRNWALTYPQNVAYWERWFADPALPEEIRAYRRRALAKVHRMYGLTFLRDAGDAATARKALWESIKARPSQLLTDWKLPAALVLAFLGLGRVNPNEHLRAARCGTDSPSGLA